MFLLNLFHKFKEIGIGTIHKFRSIVRFGLGELVFHMSPDQGSNVRVARKVKTWEVWSCVYPVNPDSAKTPQRWCACPVV